MGRMGERLSTPETARPTAHLKSMGRDEMNLAEFPLTTLADRAPRGCKTLVFENRIPDRGQSQPSVPIMGETVASLVITVEGKEVEG